MALLARLVALPAEGRGRRPVASSSSQQRVHTLRASSSRQAAVPRRRKVLCRAAGEGGDEDGPARAEPPAAAAGEPPAGEASPTGDALLQGPQQQALQQQQGGQQEQQQGEGQLPMNPPDRAAIESWLYPDEGELPEQFEMPLWDHLEELRERVLAGALACAAAVLTCFAFSKDLVVFLEAPVAEQGVRFLQLSPGEFFFTTLKVGGYAGLLLAAPTVLYEVVAYVLPGLTRSERRLLAPVVFGSSALFYTGLLFSYEVLAPAALKFFVAYADGAVESLWSIDQYFEFVLLLMLSTGLAFQVPVVQVLLGQLGLVSSQAMLGQWRFVVVGATVAAAVLTPSTDPFTQTLLAVPLIALYLGGAGAVRLIEQQRGEAPAG